jgi:hypothetical protein
LRLVTRLRSCLRQRLRVDDLASNGAKQAPDVDGRPRLIRTQEAVVLLRGVKSQRLSARRLRVGRPSLPRGSGIQQWRLEFDAVGAVLKPRTDRGSEEPQRFSQPARSWLALFPGRVPAGIGGRRVHLGTQREATVLRAEGQIVCVTTLGREQRGAGLRPLPRSRTRPLDNHVLSGLARSRMRRTVSRPATGYQQERHG